MAYWSGQWRHHRRIGKRFRKPWDGLGCNWRQCNWRVYWQVFIIRKIPTFFCGAKAVGFREGCLKQPVILRRSSIEVKQKTGFVDRWNMVGKTHSHITGDLIGLGELYPWTLLLTWNMFILIHPDCWLQHLRWWKRVKASVSPEILHMNRDRISLRRDIHSVRRHVDLGNATIEFNEIMFDIPCSIDFWLPCFPTVMCQMKMCWLTVVK